MRIPSTPHRRLRSKQDLKGGNKNGMFQGGKRGFGGLGRDAATLHVKQPRDYGGQAPREREREREWDYGGLAPRERDKGYKGTILKIGRAFSLALCVFLIFGFERFSFTSITLFLLSCIPEAVIGLVISQLAVVNVVAFWINRFILQYYLCWLWAKHTRGLSREFKPVKLLQMTHW